MITLCSTLRGVVLSRNTEEDRSVLSSYFISYFQCHSVFVLILLWVLISTQIHTLTIYSGTSPTNLSHFFFKSRRWCETFSQVRKHYRSWSTLNPLFQLWWLTWNAFACTLTLHPSPRIKLQTRLGQKKRKEKQLESTKSTRNHQTILFTWNSSASWTTCRAHPKLAEHRFDIYGLLQTLVRGVVVLTECRPSLAYNPFCILPHFVFYDVWTWC